MRIQSFHGLKNAGGQTYVVDRPQYEVGENGKMIVYPRSARLDLRVELTNENGNDLDTFKPLLEKYPNQENPNVVHLTKLQVIDDFNKQIYDYFAINDKDIKLNEKSLRSFIKMFDLVKKLETVDPKDAPVEDSYMNSMDSIKAFHFYTQFYMRDGNDGKRYVDPKFLEMLEHAHRIDWVKKIATVFNETVSDKLNEFFKNN